MNSFVILFEEQRHYVDYFSEMIDDAHVVTIFLHDQKLVNITSPQFNLIKLLGSEKQEYVFEQALSLRGNDLKRIIAEEVAKIFKKAKPSRIWGEEIANCMSLNFLGECVESS